MKATGEKNMYINLKKRNLLLVLMLAVSCFVFTACGGGDGSGSAVSADLGADAEKAQLLTLSDVEDVIESASFSLEKTGAPAWLNDVDGIYEDDEKGPEPTVYKIKDQDGKNAMMLVFVLPDYESNKIMGWTGSDDTVGMIPISGKNVTVQIVSDEMGLAEGHFDRDKLGKLIEMNEQLLKCLCENAFDGKVIDFEGSSENWTAMLELKDYTTADGEVSNQYSGGMVKFIPKDDESDVERIQKISVDSAEAAVPIKSNQTAGFIPFEDGYTGLSVDELRSEYDIQITYDDGSTEQLKLSAV